MKLRKWTVQRAGSEGHWMPGWFAIAPWPGDASAWFPTQQQAIDFATRRANDAARAGMVQTALRRWGMALHV